METPEAGSAVTLEALHSLHGVIETYPATVSSAAARVVLFRARRDMFCDDIVSDCNRRPTRLCCGTPLLWHDVNDSGAGPAAAAVAAENADEVWDHNDRVHVLAALRDPALDALSAQQRNARRAGVEKRGSAFVLSLGVTAPEAIPDGEEAFPRFIELNGVQHAIEVHVGWCEDL
jgi:hypothetical protein